MKTTILLCLAMLVLTPALAQAQPVIRANGVLNAFSELSDVARGSWFVIYGTGLGPATISVQNAAPYPAALSGTSITFTPASGGASVNALMYYTFAGKVCGMLPSSPPAGAYDVKVTYNGQTSAASRVNVVERNFGFVTQASNGQGPAQTTYGGYDLNRFTTGTLGQWSLRPAHPGDAIVLWGTGLGADPASDFSGGTSGDQTAAGQVRVIVAGIETTPIYAGRSGGPGLDQINFTVPSNVTPSCFVSIQVRVGGRLSNLGSIAVAAPGQTACSNPSLTQTQLQKLDNGGTLTIGSFHLSKITTTLAVPGFGTLTKLGETADGWFGKYTVDTVANANFTLTQSGACFLIKRTGTIDQIGFGLAPQSLDGGAQLRLNGPNAVNVPVPRQSDNSYTMTLYSSGVGATIGSPTLAQGTYTLSGTGGSGIGAFSAALSLPANFVWTNQNTIANPIPRTSPLTLTWTGGGTGLVAIAGLALAQTGGTTADPIYAGTTFNCNAPASAGTFTVPSNLLQQLPAVSADPTAASFGILSVIAVPDPGTGQGAFTAPLTAGGTIDQGFLSYGIGSLKSTGFN